MNGLPYYKRYPRDFIEGTIGLSFELKTTYAFMLDLIYVQSGRLRDDPRYIAGLLSVSVKKWNSLRDALIEAGKIRLDGEFLTNDRAITELEITAKLSGKMSENASGVRKNNNLKKQKLSHTDTDTDIKEELNSSSKNTVGFEELSAVLDEEHAKAVIDHRRKIKKPLTAHAARLLAGKFKQTRDPNASADAMISNGWQGFEAEWMDRQKPTSPKSGISASLQRYDWIILADGRVKSRAMNEDEWLLHDGVKPEQIEALAIKDFRPGKQGEVAH